MLKKCVNCKYHHKLYDADRNLQHCCTMYVECPKKTSNEYHGALKNPWDIPVFIVSVDSGCDEFFVPIESAS